MTQNSLSADEILKRAQAIGEYYGFEPFATVAAAHRRVGASKENETPVFAALDQVAETVVHFLKQCRDAELTSNPRQPMFVWHTNITPGRPAPKVASIQFHAFGTDRALADAVVIRAMRALAEEITKESPVVRINTLGDKETRARYVRELGNFFKKRGTSLSEASLECAKHDLIEGALAAVSSECANELPSPTDFLSDQSRKRFEELLDYLETTDTPYELVPHLLSRGNAWSETCFEIRSGNTSIAWGSRYADLARAVFKTGTPAVGAVFKIETTGAKITPIKNRARLRFAFVHIGEEAKRESIKLVDELRHARLPLWQIIGLESLTEQMIHVERINPPYVIIMGRKEALERSVVLRDRSTQHETPILLSELTERLRTFA
jgi:histidyl-tRNA synthetase